jgi:cysteine desulfurase
MEDFKHPETCHIITTPIEHPCVKNVCEEYRQKGTDVTYLHVDSDGRIDLEYLLSSIKDNTKLISIICVNNEIGTVQDLNVILRAIATENPML